MLDKLRTSGEMLCELVWGGGVEEEDTASERTTAVGGGSAGPRLVSATRLIKSPHAALQRGAGAATR